MTAPYQTVGIDDARRMAHTAQRRRILSGSWDEDLRAYIGEYIDTQRQASWGRPVKSVNLMRSVVGQLSVLYDETPMLRHPETEDLSALEGIFKAPPTAWGLRPWLPRVGDPGELGAC